MASFKKLIVTAALGLGLATGSANAAFIPADILWVIDVSASMGGDIGQIRILHRVPPFFCCDRDINPELR